MTVRDAHALGDEVEAAVKEQFPAVREVLVHIEPEGDAGEDEGPAR